MDTTVIHAIVTLISLTAFVVLWVVLRKLPRDFFLVSMITLSMALMANAFLFSITYLIDKMDAGIYNVYIYNWWALFIRTQNVSTILYIGILALLRVKRKI